MTDQAPNCVPDLEPRDVPVVVFAFNRPEVTSRMVAALRQVRPRRLFVFCDGPRPDRDDDVRATAEVRRAFDLIDWECQQHRFFATRNLGCTPSIEQGLDRVFDTVGEAVVLEDDCLPDPSFLRFAAELLVRYRNEQSVGFISGSLLDAPSSLFDGYSYGFSTVGAGYGWATWSDRWREHRDYAPRGRSGDLTGRPLGPADALAASTGYARWLREQAGTHDQLPWDALLAWSSACRRKLAVVPAVNMIENIGFGPGATHTVATAEVPRARTMDFPLRHPAAVRRNEELSRELEYEALWFAYGPPHRYWRRRLDDGPIRRQVTRALTSSAALAGYGRAVRARQQVSGLASRLRSSSSRARRSR